MRAYVKRTERSEISELMLLLKCPEKEKETKPKTRRRKEITKIRANIHEIETKKKEKKNT
jgi:hypothetical protein